MGTAFADGDTMPSRGRLLIFRVDPKECRLELVHTMATPGSVQAMTTLKANHKYLALGLNNRVILYTLNLRHGNHFDLIEHDSKVSGTFVQCMQAVDSQIVVGDIMKGVMVFDVKEGRQSKVTLAEGPSSSQMNIWVNEILVLTKTKYMVLDREKNIFILQRNMKPTNEIEKYKLTVVAQISAGEEITSALVGSINMRESYSEDRKYDANDIAARDSQDISCLSPYDEPSGMPMRKRGKLNQQKNPSATVQVGKDP